MEDYSLLDRFFCWLGLHYWSYPYWKNDELVKTCVCCKKDCVLKPPEYII